MMKLGVFLREVASTAPVSHNQPDENYQWDVHEAVWVDACRDICDDIRFTQRLRSGRSAALTNAASAGSGPHCDANTGANRHRDHDGSSHDAPLHADFGIYSDAYGNQNA